MDWFPHRDAVVEKLRGFRRTIVHSILKAGAVGKGNGAQHTIKATGSVPVAFGCI